MAHNATAPIATPPTLTPKTINELVPLLESCKETQAKMRELERGLGLTEGAMTWMVAGALMMPYTFSVREFLEAVGLLEDDDER